MDGLYFLIAFGITSLSIYIAQRPATQPRLQNIVDAITAVYPDVGTRYPVYSSPSATFCANKASIYINTTNCTDAEIVERVLHEYAHILNTDSYGHDDAFWDLFTCLCKRDIDLKKQNCY